MIRLHPVPDASHDCPHCHARMEVKGWHIPGMRNLADLQCPQCKADFYGDLPAGHGLYYPMLINTATGELHDPQGVPWFAQSLKESFASRTDQPVPFHEEQFRPLKRGVLLNCLDSIYGHSLLKLLNVQYYMDHKPELDPIVMVPRFLRWMVPQGVAAIWTVDVPLRQGSVWNEWLARQIKERLTRLKAAHLSVALSHPHPADFQIQRFTGIVPFDLQRVSKTRLKSPKVTFIWRSDRPWEGGAGRLRSGAKQLWARSACLPGSASRSSGDAVLEGPILKLAKLLRQSVPDLDIAIAGMGQPGELPSWVSDLRHSQPDDEIERAWCRRYAESRLVVGVHGSHLLLPSAHAGGVIELLPCERWGNLMQDLLVRDEDPRSALFRIRVLPIQSTPQTVAEAAISLIQDAPLAALNFEPPWCNHAFVAEDPFRVSRQRHTWSVAS